MIKVDKNTVEFNHQRWYNVDEGVYYPSITTILGATEDQSKIDSLNRWRDAVRS
jgi:hypothetical protein